MTETIDRRQRNALIAGLQALEDIVAGRPVNLQLVESFHSCDGDDATLSVEEIKELWDLVNEANDVLAFMPGNS